MTRGEIEQGEIIKQNGIVNVLESLGFKRDEDFIFLPEEINRGIELDTGVKKQEIMLNFEKFNGSVDENGHIRYGITSGNNGVGAVYVPFQGLVLSPDYDIKNVMQEKFLLKDTGFSVPLSNGEQFVNKTLQSKWDNVRDNKKSKDLNSKNFTADELAHKRKDKMEKIERATLILQRKVDVKKMPQWAQEQLKGKNM